MRSSRVDIIKDMLSNKPIFTFTDPQSDTGVLWHYHVYLYGKELYMMSFDGSYNDRDWGNISIDKIAVINNECFYYDPHTKSYKDMFDNVGKKNFLNAWQNYEFGLAADEVLSE